MDLTVREGYWIKYCMKLVRATFLDITVIFMAYIYKLV
jgi:hypothetical protein